MLQKYKPKRITKIWLYTRFLYIQSLKLYRQISTGPKITKELIDMQHQRTIKPSGFLLGGKRFQQTLKMFPQLHLRNLQTY
jgi:hypothetical protein